MVRPCPGFDMLEVKHESAQEIQQANQAQNVRDVEFPTNGGRADKLYSVCSYSAGDTYPSDECRRRVL